MSISQITSYIFCLLFISSLNAQELEKAVPFFIDGEAQIVEAFKSPDDWIRHDLFVETDFDTDGDGKNDRMHVAVTRPKQTETEGLKLPVIYVSSPYFAGVAPDVDGVFWGVKHELGEIGEPRVHPPVTRRGERPVISYSHLTKWIPRGYIVVHSSSPGTGFSQGSPTVGGINESLAPKSVIEWLCAKRKGYTEPEGGEEVKATWCTGKVGMTGTSYNGTIPLAAATTGVEGLEAIIPIAPNTSYYHYYRSHGLVRSPGGYLGEDIDVLYDYIHSGDVSKREHNNREVRDKILVAGMDRESGDYNDFWAGRDYLNAMDNMKAALLMSHGFNDWNVMPEHSYRIYKKANEMGLETQLYYHQNGHGGPPPMTMMNRWFTHYLHGIDNGVNDDPAVKIVRERDDHQKPTAYEAYPHIDSKAVTFYSKAGESMAPGTIQTKPPNDQTKLTIVDNYSFDGESLAKAEYTNHRLMFLSPVLQEELHLSGVTEVTIKLAANKEAANLSVWMVSLPWDEGRKVKITDNIITRGWADPQNHASISKSDPLVPGEFVSITFDLQPDDQIIRKGQQIGIMIFSSDRDFTLWPKPGTEVTVDLDGTSFSLPIVGGEEAFQKAVGN